LLKSLGEMTLPSSGGFESSFPSPVTNVASGASPGVYPTSVDLVLAQPVALDDLGPEKNLPVLREEIL
jgi:hypothetical protein